MFFAGMWRAFAELAGSVAVSALWQGLAVALGLAICLRLTPRISARDRFRAWVAGFAALVVLPFLPGVLAWIGAWFAQSLPAADLAAGATGTSAAQPWFDLDARWSLVIAGLWVVASLLRAID